jgi:rubrerythrin
MHERLLNEAARNVANNVVNVFAPLLRDEEKQDAYEEVIERVKAGIMWYCLECDRIRQRLHPTRN